MIIVALQVFLVIAAIYGVVWIGVVALLCRVTRKRGLSFLESDATVSLFALRVIAVAMVLFPVFVQLLYVPCELDMFGTELLKPRLIDDMSVAFVVATATALLVSCAVVVSSARPRRAPSPD